MYGTSSKLGRGGPAIARGGGAGPKRFPAPQPPTRPTAPSRPLSAGARNRMNSVPGSAKPAAAEETFNLVSGNDSHVFGMIIRLAPDLIEEIKRVEAQGEFARIKFDSNANNTAGNVIDVAGKEYRFTWSREFGDLCDIYEERQSGEEGNGLLVESGCAWRKVNVQRVLDESTKNHVKMRSEEAERKHKSRKAIVLEHGNASMKSQVKQLAAAEVNPRRMFFKKKEPPNKKLKVEPRHVSTGEFSRSGHKMGFSSAFKTNAKGGRLSSPLPSSPAQRNASISPSGADNLMRSSMTVEEAVHTPLMGKENAAGSDRDMMNKATAPVKERAGSKVNLGAPPMDLQSMLISLLTTNPKGMSLKAIEKAIGDTFPNSGKKIEPILKKIATYQAPGRYLLKSEADFESFKRSSSASGSSPEDNNNHITVPAEEDCNQTSLPKPAFEEKAPSDEGFAQLKSAVGEEMNASEDVDIEHHSPDLIDKASENSEGQAGSSSDSGSDSDSDSGSSDSRSESGSPSGSRSRSRSKSPSPIRSGSVSSSDSESDASSNSKEGSDQDVDIMTSDDEKDPANKLQASEQGFSTPPEGRRAQDGIDNKQDGHESNFVDIEKEFEEAHDHTVEETGLISKKEHSRSQEENIPVSFKHDDFIERQNFIVSLFDEKETNFSDNFKSEHSDSREKARKDKSQREYDPKLAINPECVKRLKGESLSQQPVAGTSIAHNSLSPSELSPNRSIEDSFKISSHQIMNRANRDSDAELGSQRGWDQAYPGKSSLNSHQYSNKSFNQGNRATAHDPARRPNKSESLGSDTRLSSKNFNSQENLNIHKEKSGKETFSEGHVSDKSSRSKKEGGNARKHYAPPDSHHQKTDETSSRFKEVEHTNTHVESLPKGNSRAGISPLVNGRGAVLQRELSDLELGELREPVADEVPTKKQFERNSSFKMSENKLNKSNSWNVDVARGKPPEKESGKPSSPNLGTRIFGSTESNSRKRTFENRGDDFTMPVQPGMQSQLPFSSKIDHGENGWQTNNMVDVNKSKRSEVGARRGINPEESRKSQKGASIEGTQHVDNKWGQASQAVKEGKPPASNVAPSTASGQKDAISADNSGYKRRESSSDENSPYSKYEKNEPELKGRIKDYSQYKEYVQEYRDKYESYCSLNKTLENYRVEFQKLGKDLESAKGRDVERYNNLLQELKESYRQCGTRHKKLKKIFMVLHEELKNLKQMIKDYALTYSRD